MYENSGQPPDAFIREVLWRYYRNRERLDDIAMFYGLPELVIARIVCLYVLDDNTLESPEKRSFRKRKNPEELKDAVRKISEKLTPDDLTDLKIDLNLFEKGEEPDGKKN